MLWQGTDRTGAGLWVSAVLGALSVLIGPLSPGPWIETAGLVVSLVAIAALVTWVVRR